LVRLFLKKPKSQKAKKPKSHIKTYPKGVFGKAFFEKAQKAKILENPEK
jgi:hypothetical protein